MFWGVCVGRSRSIVCWSNMVAKKQMCSSRAIWFGEIWGDCGRLVQYWYEQSYKSAYTDNMGGCTQRNIVGNLRMRQELYPMLIGWQRMKQMWRFKRTAKSIEWIIIGLHMFSLQSIIECFWKVDNGWGILKVQGEMILHSRHYC